MSTHRMSVLHVLSLYCKTRGARLGVGLGFWEVQCIFSPLLCEHRAALCARLCVIPVYVYDDIMPEKTVNSGCIRVVLWVHARRGISFQNYDFDRFIILCISSDIAYISKQHFRKIKIMRDTNLCSNLGETRNPLLLSIQPSRK